MGEPVHRRHAFDSRQLPYLLPYGASGPRRRELLEIAVVHVQEAQTRTAHSNAEDDLYDPGLVGESWCRRQNGNVSVYRSTTRRRGVDGGRFNRRQPRKGLLKKLKREGMSVHRGFCSEPCWGLWGTCRFDGFRTLRFLLSNLGASECWGY